MTDRTTVSEGEGVSPNSGDVFERSETSAAIDIVAQARQYAAAARMEPFGIDDPGLDRDTAAAWVERLVAEVERLRAEREALHSDEMRDRLARHLNEPDETYPGEWDEYSEHFKDKYRRRADAVLSVLTADPETREHVHEWADQTPLTDPPHFYCDGCRTHRSTGSESDQ